MIDQDTAGAEPIIRLKNYVFFKETDAGVWFDAGSRSFLLKGEKIYPVIERLLTSIDSGSASRSALINSVPDRLRPLVEQLVGALDAHGMLIETTSAEGVPTPGHTPAAEWRKFLQDQLDGPGAHVAEAALGSASVLVTGHGFALKAAARTIAHAGCRAITLIVDRETASVSGDEIVRSLEPGSIAVSVHHRPPREEDVRSADLIVVAADADGDDVSGLTATRWARQHGKICIATCVRHGRGWVGPPAVSDHAGLEDLVDWLRLSPPLEADASPASLSITGGLAAHIALCQFAGLDERARRGRSVMVSPWLDVETRPVTPSPRLHRDQPVQAGDTHGLAGLPDGRTLSPFETARSALAPWFDGLIGAFNIDAVKDIPQIPLYHDALAVRRPDLSGDPLTVIAWGFNAEEAGLRLLRSAIQTFAGVGDRPYAAEFEETAWRRAAFVEAAVRCPLFHATREFAEIRAEEIDVSAARALLPLIRLFTTDAVDLRLFWSREQDIRIAECWIGGEALSVVNHFAGDAAIVDAMGEACSRLQLRASGYDRPLSRFTPRDGSETRVSMATDWREFLRVSGAAPWPAHYSPDKSLGLPPGVWAGHADIIVNRDAQG